MIEDFHKITEGGEKLYPDWWKALVGMDLGVNLKVDRIIAARWVHDGKFYEKK